jgi:hypothetical protein
MIMQMTTTTYNEGRKQPFELVICKTIRDCREKMPAMELLTNVLEYSIFYTKCRQKMAQAIVFLRFCVLYGLDGAMNDVLKGCYYHKDPDQKSGLTIVALLPLDTDPIEEDISLKCLVSGCDCQFRWITPTQWEVIHRRLLCVNEYESTPFWKGDLDKDEMMWEYSRGRRTTRASASYKEQMTMLDGHGPSWHQRPS